MAVIWIGAKDGVFTVYEADSGKQRATSAQDIGFIWALVFSPDGRRIATAGEDGVTRLWDTSTGKDDRRNVEGTRERSSAWRSARMAGAS